ncbi:bifunctional chorismate mutase/prephenate dehydrogenase [Rheinheimera sp. F8]|uniref:bifunctional chorismate mutase/prephenate dehydrogenase n=1 Tax=Rheinheimera sp. F8 TaxID=1763998 RepID=UPI0007448226|nr:bifunctional chorismate mutase/prephenate dehydrogenase [Rheinheimera sp. F8]ALZ76235.1 bifunctional chorismate mutase/prephenate dehydrogenase [Rheinheimera sp. F8]ALZ77584.1 bifunctional chorismate mutase/prephenate dehydrogenase [Rheinheimera sp. F8]
MTISTSAQAASAAELAPLRQQIDAIDTQLVQLLAARAKVTAQVGQVKQQYALPLYVPEREKALLEARRAQAETVGVSPELVEDVLRRVMRESYSTQETGFVCCREGGGKVVVVGGRGALGQRFVSLFQRSGFVVSVLEQTDWPQAAEICADASLVLLAVPIAVTEQVIRQLPTLPANCILADITSIKAAPLAAMLQQHAGPVLGLHPMFGPDISNIVKQVVVVCHGRAAEQYQWLLQQFSVWGAVLTEKDARQHDELMQLIQAMRHFSSLVYGVHLAEEQADLPQLLELSSPIYRLELAMVGRLFAQNAELYADIMLSSVAVTGLLQRYQHRFNQLSHLLAARDKAGLMAEFAKGQQFFGPLASQFLQESRRLLQKAADERS